jgi:hypothetical protein
MHRARSDGTTRAAHYKRIHRRDQLLRHAFTSIVPEAFSQEELFHLVFGSAVEARRAFSRASRRPDVRPFTKKEVAQPAPNRRRLTHLPRPTRVLSRLNRSPVFPPLVSNDYQTDEVSITGILAALRGDCGTDPAHRLLDAFAIASGLPWEDCAQLLRASRLISTAIDAEDLNATRHARLFWNHFEEGRARYAALVGATAMAQFQGDWAYFDAEQLDALLPCLIIPTRLKRHDYLTNYVSEGSNFSLDVYAGSSVAPLFQHPFLSEFNPLRFGKMANYGTFRSAEPKNGEL